MPLKSGSSPSTISSNIEEFHTGKTYAHTRAKFGKERANKQAIAVAMSEARGRAFGGVAPMMGQAFNPAGMMGPNPATQTMPQTPTNGVAGGIMPTPMMPPQMGLNAPPPGLNGGMPGPAGARPFAHGGTATNTFKGPIVSTVPGRTDKHFTHVPSGSYVIPADIVSAHGEGNSLAGMQTLHKLFKLDPHPIQHFAKGGSAHHVNKPVPVKLAGGEIVIPPENVQETMSRVSKKKLTLDQSHAAMDQWVLNQRKKLRKTLAKLPGPSKD